MTAVESLLKKHFGTQSALANLLGVQQSTVSGWNQRDAIPHTRQRQIIEKAAEKGIEVLPSDFFPKQSETA